MNIRTSGPPRDLPDPPLNLALIYLRDAVKRGERPQSTGKVIVDARDLRSVLAALEPAPALPARESGEDLEPDPDELLDDDPSSQDQPDPDDRAWAESGR